MNNDTNWDEKIESRLLYHQRDKHTDGIRKIITLSALIGVASSVAIIVWFLWAGKVEEAKLVGQIVLAPVISMTGTILGFYFAKSS
jgi:hypothetical protein